jgi:hypothetical protein
VNCGDIVKEDPKPMNDERIGAAGKNTEITK